MQVAQAHLVVFCDILKIFNQIIGDAHWLYKTTDTAQMVIRQKRAVFYLKNGGRRAIDCHRQSISLNYNAIKGSKGGFRQESGF
jgi:hypothetical protein